MKSFPTLYKKTSTGAIQEWTITVYAGKINTTFGQVDGKKQVTQDVISAGKNVGKSNETTINEQAEAEAFAKWEKQKKKGYVEDINSAEEGEVDALIEGGIEPMLAFTFEKQGKKIAYPCFTQPKLDGIRVIAVLKNGKCSLWSRTRKRITSLPHIVAEIEDKFVEDITLDGEAYNHEYKANFEEITSLVRQEVPHVNCTKVEYHIYDIVGAEPFSTRTQTIKRLFDEAGGLSYLKRVETEIVESENDVPDYFIKYRGQGYEGAMLRNSAGLYVNKRSPNLIKVKEMQDDEFEIIGIDEGRGKLAGHVGSFVCKTASGDQFNAKMKGDINRLKEYFKNHSIWKGKMLTVQFQDYTAYGIPRFPVGVRIREED